MKLYVAKKARITIIIVSCFIVAATVVLRISENNNKVKDGERERISADTLDTQYKTAVLDTVTDRKRTNAKAQTHDNEQYQLNGIGEALTTIDHDDRKDLMPQLRVVNVMHPSQTRDESRIPNGDATGQLTLISHMVNCSRRDIADLDNVYNQLEVASIRNSSIEKYLSKSEAALEQQDWTNRKVFRILARKHLKEGIVRLQKLYEEIEDNDLRTECLLAITELVYKSEKYPQAIEYAQEVVDRNSKSRLTSRALYYLEKSHAMLGELDISKRYIKLLREDHPGEADIFFGKGKLHLRVSSEYESMLRKQAFYLKHAERMDDALLCNIGDSDVCRRRRDNAISKAEEIGERPIGELEQWLEEEALDSVIDQDPIVIWGKPKTGD